MSNPPAPTAPEEIGTLREAVEAASGPSKDLFIRARCELLPDEPWDEEWDGRMLALLIAEAWTDAALALVDRVLPDRRVDLILPASQPIDQRNADRPSAKLTRDVRYHEMDWCEAPTPALAILAALLRALETRHEA